MQKLSPEIEKDLQAVAEKHDLTLSTLYWIIYHQENIEYDKEDIRYSIRELSEFNSWLIDKDRDNQFVDTVYERYENIACMNQAKDFSIEEAIRQVAEGYDED